LRHHRKERETRLAPGGAHQGIDHHLQHRHAETDHEQPGDDDHVDRVEADSE